VFVFRTKVGAKKKLTKQRKYISNASEQKPKSVAAKYLHPRKKNSFVTATKLGTANKYFVAATKRFVDRTKHFVVVTKYFCCPYFNK